jgi:hypothetical protein
MNEEELIDHLRKVSEEVVRTLTDLSNLGYTFDCRMGTPLRHKGQQSEMPVLHITLHKCVEVI